MKITIIAFSPSGHTLKVSQSLKAEFEKSGADVQLLDITRQDAFLHGTDIADTLMRALECHDVLLIGGPVYAGHVEKHVLRIIKSLPKPQGKYGKLVVPFVTYGGVHSSVALEEMGRLLRRQNRVNILGIKIAAFHTLSKTFTKTINEGKPGSAEEIIIQEAVRRIVSAVKSPPGTVKDAQRMFEYASPKKRLIFNLLSQDALHRKHRNVSIDKEKCVGCKKCVAVCPVNMYVETEGSIRLRRDKSECILCAECFHSCPTGAVRYSYLEPARKRIRDGVARLERDQSAIYP